MRASGSAWTRWSPRGFLKKWSVCSAPGFRIPAPRCQAIGYKEIAAALRGECSPEDAIETVKRESCRYAKRQLTWLRRDRDLVWLPREEYPTEDDLLAVVLKN